MQARIDDGSHGPLVQGLISLRTAGQPQEQR
jgi:hypothetical protein